MKMCHSTLQVLRFVCPALTFLVLPQWVNGQEKRQETAAVQVSFVDQPVEISASKAPRLGTGDFSLNMWLENKENAAHNPGDLISQFDPVMRRGFHLTLKSNTGTTTSQANWRHLQFGIDNNQSSGWIDCGRPGNATLAFALVSHEGRLYAGTCEPGKNESGHVYFYAGTKSWTDCGAPDKSNSVTALAAYQGKLFAGTGKYRLAGSQLKESENAILGGRVFVYEGGRNWIDCGSLPNTEAVGGFVVFQGQLYASSLYKPAGFFRYEGGNKWTDLPVPQGLDPATGILVPKRVEALTVFDGFLYGSSYDGGHVYRYDGKTWTDCGRLGDNTQTYSFAQYEGKLYAGTWPSGRVYRFDGVGKWTDTGRLGKELEVMGMLVHNGLLLAGTLPLAEVYSFDTTSWKRLVRLDQTPNVTYRRAWTMAEHEGQVFCSTLPSGKVFAFSSGKLAVWGKSLDSSRHHVAAIKSADRLALYVDGQKVAESLTFDAKTYLLNCDAPLRIGNGMNGPFHGRLSDVQVHTRALRQDEIVALAKQKKLK
ncbi:MAG: LamG domain-containing protein [Gemmataceae bacterium]|nr:LamG domain-containing protein [Gemmataceae bacterium]